MILWPENNEVVLATKDAYKIALYTQVLGEYGIKVIPIQLPTVAGKISDFNLDNFEARVEVDNVLKIAKEAHAATGKAVIAELSCYECVNISHADCKAVTTLVYIDDVGTARGFSGAVYGTRDAKGFMPLFMINRLKDRSEATNYRNDSSYVAISRLMEDLIDDHFLKTTKMPHIFIDQFKNHIANMKRTHFMTYVDIDVVIVDRRLPSEHRKETLESQVDDDDILIETNYNTYNRRYYTIDGNVISVSFTEGYRANRLFRFDPVIPYDYLENTDDAKIDDIAVTPVIYYDDMDMQDTHALMMLCTNPAFGRKLAYKLHLMGISEIRVRNNEDYDILSKILGSGGTTLVKLILAGV